MRPNGMPFAPRRLRAAHDGPAPTGLWSRPRGAARRTSRRQTRYFAIPRPGMHAQDEGRPSRRYSPSSTTLGSSPQTKLEVRGLAKALGQNGPWTDARLYHSLLTASMLRPWVVLDHTFGPRIERLRPQDPARPDIVQSPPRLNPGVIAPSGSARSRPVIAP